MHETTQRYSPYTDSPFKPHWALENLQGGEHPALLDLQVGKDYPHDADYWKALGSADPERPGWVPTWFPRWITRTPWTPQARTEKISPQQRLDWFDKALQHYAPTELNPNDKSSSTMRSIAQSLLLMQRAAASEEIPTPDKL